MTSTYIIGRHFEAFIREQVESGRYVDESDVVRAGLRLLEEREHLRDEHMAELRDATEEGMNSGPGIPAEEVFEELRDRYRNWPTAS